MFITLNLTGRFKELALSAVKQTEVTLLYCKTLTITHTTVYCQETQTKTKEIPSHQNLLTSFQPGIIFAV